MPNPNFLTANTSGIELMPGVNDMAVGYDVNRIIQALNGTNLVPIITGDLTVNGVFSVVGGGSTTGDFTVGGRLIFSTAVSKIVPGATSISLRNHADSADNLLIADNGDLTGRTKLTMPGPLVLTTATSKIIPGATSLSLRNTGDSADNMLIADAGGVTFRAGLSGITTLSMSGALSGATDITGSGITTGGILKATGAPSLGSAAAGRYIGNWTTAGAPTGLTGVVGDHGFDTNLTLWVCTAAGTPGTWATEPQIYKMSATYDSSLTVTSATWTAVPLNTEDYDPNNNFDSATTHLYTVPKTGYYLLIARTETNSAATQIGARFDKNSGTFISQYVIPAAAATQGISADVVALTSGDTIGLQMFENGITGSQTVHCAMKIHYMSAT